MKYKVCFLCNKRCDCHYCDSIPLSMVDDCIAFDSCGIIFDKLEMVLCVDRNGKVVSYLNK